MRTLLTWRKPTDHPQDRDYAVWMADGIGGRYSIESGGLLWFAHDEFIWEQCSDEASAKARAEADFRERLAPFVDWMAEALIARPEALNAPADGPGMESEGR